MPHPSEPPGPRAADRQFAIFVRRGSTEALALAFELVAPELLRCALGLTRSSDDARDLVQETFIAAIEAKNRFDRGRSLLPWLVGTMQNLHRYRRRAEARSVDPDRMRPPGDTDPPILVDRKLILEQIDRGIAALPLTYRDVVALHLQSGLRPEEISRRLGRPAGRVRTQLWRGLRHLRGSLPAGLAPLVIAFLSVESAHAAVAGWTAGAAVEGAPATTPPTGIVGSVRRLRSLPRPRALLAMLVPLAAAFVVAPALWPAATTDAAPLVDLPTHDASPIAASIQRSAPPQDAVVPRVAAAVEPSAPGRVHAHLVWSDSGLPAAQQSVRLAVGAHREGQLLQTWFATVREGMTDAGGDVLFDEVPPGPARLLFDDGAANSAEFSIASHGLVELNETLQPTCEVLGIVVDSSDCPVAGAAVWLSSSGGLTSPGYIATHTATDGTFAVRALHRQWSAWATAAGLARSAVHREATSITISHPRLVLGPMPARLEGLVVSSDGAPLADAVVGAYALQGARYPQLARCAAPVYLRCDANGRFAVDGLEPGPHILVARGKATSADVQRVDLAPGAGAHVEFRLGGGATVRGHAPCAAETGPAFVVAGPPPNQREPCIAAMVDVTAAVQADGSYCAERVSPGDVEVRLCRPAPVPDASARIRIADGQLAEIDLRPNAPTRAEPTLNGYVVDENGTPIDGIEVRSMPAEFDWRGMRDDFARTVTAAGGRFGLPARPGVAYRCVAMHALEFASGSSEPVTAEHTEALRITIASQRAAASVRGSLLGSTTSTTLADIELVQLPLGQRQQFALTADGRFAVEQLPPGDFLLTAQTHNDRRRTRLTTFHLAAGEAKDLGALVEPVCSDVRIRMRRDDGRGVRLASVIDVHLARTPAVVAAIDLESGEARLQLAPDDYQFDFQGLDFRPERHRVSVVNGQPIDLQFDVAPASTCALTFALPGDAERTRLWLRIDGPDGSRLVDRALPVPEGFEYRFDLGLPPGKHHVRAVTARGLVADDVVTIPDAIASTPMAVRLALH